MDYVKLSLAENGTLISFMFPLCLNWAFSVLGAQADMFPPIFCLKILSICLLRGSSILPRLSINNSLKMQNMEQLFRVFSTLVDDVVYTGTKPECDGYKESHETIDNSLYIVPQP